MLLPRHRYNLVVTLWLYWQVLEHIRRVTDSNVRATLIRSIFFLQYFLALFANYYLYRFLSLIGTHRKTVLFSHLFHLHVLCVSFLYFLCYLSCFKFLLLSLNLLSLSTVKHIPALFSPHVSFYVRFLGFFRSIMIGCRPTYFASSYIRASLCHLSAAPLKYQTEDTGHNTQPSHWHLGYQSCFLALTSHCWVTS